MRLDPIVIDTSKSSEALPTVFARSKTTQKSMQSGMLMNTTVTKMTKARVSLFIRTLELLDSPNPNDAEDEFFVIFFFRFLLPLPPFFLEAWTLDLL